MAFSSCLCHPLTIKPIGNWRDVAVDQRLTTTRKSRNIETFGRPVAGIGADLRMEWSFIAGSRVIMRPQIATFICQHKGFRVSASYMFVFLGTIASYDIFPKTFLGMSGPQLASTMFTLGTAAVLPFYTLMVFAPKAELLPGIAKMFSSEITLASAWIHLLAVDLFAARHVFQDGLHNEIETRHSVSLCLLFCPIGILTHVITKALTKSS